MSFDNRIFNVNGKGHAMLLDALKLVFEQSGMVHAYGWIKDPEKGLILLWCADPENPGYHPFPSLMQAEDVLPVVKAYLKSDDADAVAKEQWEHDQHDSDITCEKGWRVYCEDWGHVKSITSAICAIKLVYIWYGK